MKHYMHMSAKYENDEDFIRFFKEVEMVALRYGIDVSYLEVDRLTNKIKPKYTTYFER